jgi:hypothetical protein
MVVVRPDPYVVCDLCGARVDPHAVGSHGGIVLTYEVRDIMGNGAGGKDSFDLCSECMGRVCEAIGRCRARRREASDD